MTNISPYIFITSDTGGALILLILDTIWGQMWAMGTFFQIKKRKFENLQKKIGSFGSVSYKQHKAHLSCLLTQEHICVEVFCFSFLQ